MLNVWFFFFLPLLWAPLEGASLNCNVGLLELREILANSVCLSVCPPAVSGSGGQSVTPFQKWPKTQT